MAMQVNRPVTCTLVPPTSYHKSPWEKRGVACKVYVLSVFHMQHHYCTRLLALLPSANSQL